MGKFVVFNSVKWKPPVRSKLLNPPELKLNVSFPDKDLREMTKKHRAAFDKEFKAFDAKFHKLGIGKIKDIQSAINWTEERIQKKKSKKEAQKVIDTANVMLKKAFKTFESEIRTLAQKCYEEAIVKSRKAMKMRLVKSVVKAVVIITIIVLLTLSAAGIGIVAGIAGGAAGGVVLVAAVVTALVTGCGAIIAAIATIKKYWASVDNQIKLIQKDIDKLEKATKDLEKYRNLATTGHRPAMDKLKKTNAIIQGKLLVNLDKHIGQLDKFMFKISKDLAKTTKELEMLTKKINKTGDKKLKKKADKLLYDTMNALGKLREIDNLKNEAKAIQMQFAKNKTPNFGRLGVLIREVNDMSPWIVDIVKGGKGLGQAIGDL